MSQIIEVPVSLRIAVSVPEGSDASSFATIAAEHLTHVSHAAIAAFNETNRIHPSGIGTVESVAAAVVK